MTDACLGLVGTASKKLRWLEAGRQSNHIAVVCDKMMLQHQICRVTKHGRCDTVCQKIILSHTTAL